MHAKYDSIQFAGTSYLLRAYLEVVNIASGSEANITTPCEMEIFNFLWLIWDHYIPRDVISGYLDIRILGYPSYFGYPLSR